MGGIAFHCDRLRKIGSKRPEATIGMDCAVPIHTENVVLSILATSSDEDVTAGAIDEQVLG